MIEDKLELATKLSELNQSMKWGDKTDLSRLGKLSRGRMNIYLVRPFDIELNVVFANRILLAAKKYL